MIKNFLKNHTMLIIIVMLASLLRFIHLDKIPTAVNGDELLYAITAKSIFLTGRDITGTWNPLSIFAFQYPPGEHQAELPYFIHLVFGGSSPFSLFLAKFPFALLGIGVVILIYKIAEILFGKTTAIWTGFIAAINPWLIVMGRTGYESTPATFFYLLSLYMLLTFRAWKILWCLVPLFLAFYSYIGTKLIFIPFVFISLFLAYEKSNHKFRKMYATVCGISILFVIGFVLILHVSSGGSRFSEIVLPNSPLVSQQVDVIRKSTIQTSFLPLFVNKYTVYIQMITEKLFRIFTPSYLFIEGDQFFLPVKQSFFYVVDSVFILLGALYLFSKNKLRFILIILFILVGTFPQIFHKNPGDSSIHISLIFPFIIFLIGFGISNIVENVTRKYISVAKLIIVLVYGISLGGFCITYFYQFPLIGAGDFHMRILSRYLKLVYKPDTQVTVYTTTSSDVLKKYLFYTNGMTKQTMPEIRRIFSYDIQNIFQNIKFVSCDDSIKSIDGNKLVIYDVKCGMDIDAPHIQISRLSDAGGIYKIYNDTLCSKYALTHYPTGIKISDFNVEGMPTERFCKTYFSN